MPVAHDEPGSRQTTPDPHTDAEKPRDPGRGDPADEAPEDLPSANDLLGTLFEEASLWPLLTVILGSTGAFGAALLVLAGVDRNPFAAGALVLLFGMSVDLIVRSRRRPAIRNLAKLVAMFWTAAILLAIVAITTGIA
jgi:hypothetical protein